MKSTYVFDTMGTTIPEQAVKNLNESFFQHGEQIGYSREEIEELKSLRQANPKDPQFLKKSGPGKVRLLESGLATVDLYPDVLPVFKHIDRFREEPSEGSYIRIFTKGASDLVTAIYTRADLMKFIGEKNITSSTDFKIPDKTNPDCYKELSDLMRKQEQYMGCYITDDVDEANACQKALQTMVFYVDRGQERKKPLEGPHEVKSLNEVVDAMALEKDLYGGMD